MTISFFGVSDFSPILFDDIDQYREFAKQLDWDFEVTQLSSGRTEIKFDHFVFPEILVLHHQLKQVLYEVFEVPPGHFVLAICRAKLPANLGGMDLPPSLGAILRPKRTYCVRLRVSAARKSRSTSSSVDPGGIDSTALRR